MNKLLMLLILPLLLVGCVHASIYDPEEIKNYTGVSVTGTNGVIEYDCHQLQNTPDQVPIVCYFKNTSDHVGGTAIRVAWYFNDSGWEIIHTEWGGRWDVEPGQTEKYYFFYPLADMRLRCGYNLDRCTMLVDKY